MADFDESKKVSTEDMEQVAGGTAKETADDSRFLNVLLRGRPCHCDRYGENTVFLVNHDEEIFRAWASVGVTCKINSGSFSRGNRYFIDDKEVSRDEAWKHAETVVGKHLEKSDWDW